MIIISWDVGIIHLAYCVLDFTVDNEKTNVQILDWDEINLMENEKISFKCCGKMKIKKGENIKICEKNATYYMLAGFEGKTYGFCKTHLSQADDYWTKDNTEKLFSPASKTDKCSHMKPDDTKCDKGAKYFFNENNNKMCYCTPHYKSMLNKKLKEYSPQPIKNLIVKKYPTSQLQLLLVQKLDNLAKHFAKLGINEVVIENQPSMKNPKMKAIASTLFDYFMIRGYIDKIHDLDIQLVRFMCPSNKLKVNNKNTIEVFKASKDKAKYKLTKTLGIQYTRQLLEKYPKQLEYLDLYKKKDDLCDAYLQGRYYLEFIKNKPPITKNKKPINHSTSKTAKKPMISLKIKHKNKKSKNKPIISI